MSQPESGPAKNRPNQRGSRRQKPKSSTRAHAYGNWLGLGTNIAVSVLDVSESGVRLQVMHELAIDEEFEVNLQSFGLKKVKALAKVIWVVKAADGSFIVGAKFNKPIGYPDLHVIAKV